jgi:hypothetical protein
MSNHLRWGRRSLTALNSLVLSLVAKWEGPEALGHLRWGSRR